MNVRKLHKSLFILPILICLFGLNDIEAQKSLKKGDKQFELKAYELAITSYEKELENQPNSMHCQFQIAESYRLINQNVEAAIWYRKLLKSESLPTGYYKNFGLVMKKMGQYDKASELFAKHYTVDPVESDYLMESCEYAKSLLTGESNYEVSLFPASSKNTDFAPALFMDKIVYTSFRNDLRRENAKENVSIVNPRGPQLFVSKSGFDGNVNNTGFLRSDIDEDYSIVSMNFAKNSTICAITRSEEVHPGLAYNSEDTDMSIYLASVDQDGHIFNEVPFPFNEVGSSAAFPTLNEQGTIMYFSSNRVGGSGGYDLYVSYLKEGSWTYPENLGFDINTKGNEITPYFDGYDLWFSSDYHKGLGGYDLFVSSVNDGKWETPNNLGNGVNSPEDDLFCIKHPLTEDYYVSSNRLGGRGNHDIYIITDKKQESQEILAQVTPPAAVNLEDKSKIDELSNTLPSEVVTVSNSNTTQTNKVNEVESEMNPVNQAKPSTTMVSTEATKKVIAQVNSATPPPAMDLSSRVIEDKIVEETKAVTTTKELKDSNVTLVAAKKVSSGDIILSSTPVYFIQLAAMFRTEANAIEFSNVSSLGSLYKIFEGGATKIKLGYFYDEFQAKSVLSKVRSMGYNDAFVTYAPINTSNMELIYSTGESTSMTTGNLVNKKYKIRLVSYEDPSWFDLETVKDLGTIEQWSKGSWTIFVLSGFRDYEEAEAAKRKAINRGYVDADLVVDNNGILEKINRN